MVQRNIGRMLLSLMLILFTGGAVSATDWTITDPIGIGYTNIVNDQFVITGNFASVGNASTYDLNSGGTYTSSVIFSNCNSCLYTMINPIDNTRWGADEAGNVFYTTALSPIDYSSGFFTTGFGGSCSGLGGNCNNLHRVATLTGNGYNRKMAFDSSGNVYTNDGAIIYRFIKSLDYSQQTFYTMVAGTDYTVASSGGGATLVVNVLGIDINSTDYVHILVGTATSGGAPGARAGYLSYTVINPSAVRVYSALSIESDTTGACACDGGFYYGGLVIDDTNPTYNYTYAAHGLIDNDFILKHNRSTGAATTIATLTGITSLNDIGYYNFQIYLAAQTQNLIRSYVTTFEGQTFSNTPSNPDGITGTFTWVNGYGSSITTMTPGMALSYRWTISNELENYTFFSGWGSDTQTEPSELHDLTDLTGLGKPAVFQTSSNQLAGSTIYGYLLARRNNDSQWSMLTNPQSLTISPASVGYDSITLDKTFYNLTGDTISATFTYSDGYPPYFYEWQLCARVDCSDGVFFNKISLVGEPSTSSTATDGLKEGNYYAVLMRHIPIITGLTNEILAYQRFEVRPPVIGLSWDKPTYNLLPKSSTSVCQDSTPTLNYWSNITGYAGLQRGWFSCSQTPADANANNSIMRASLFARYNGSFYLNNSLGNIWNGTLNNGSGALIYVLTNSSPTETWTLSGLNNSTPGCGCGNETFYANAEVEAESSLGYSISVSPKTAYNGDTLYFTFTKPIYVLTDFVLVKDARGTTVASFDRSATSGSYYIDPSKEYAYGTWTAYWNAGGIALLTKNDAVVTFNVKNSGRPLVTPNIGRDGEVPTGEQATNSIANNLTRFMAMPAFWGLILWVLVVYGVASQPNTKKDSTLIVAFLAANIEAAIGLWYPFTFYILALTWIIAAILFVAAGKRTTGGED